MPIGLAATTPIDKIKTTIPKTAIDFFMPEDAALAPSYLDKIAPIRIPAGQKKKPSQKQKSLSKS